MVRVRLGHVAAVLAGETPNRSDEVGVRRPWDLLNENTRTTHFILTPSQETSFSLQLDPRLFSEDEMRRYFNEFNETDEQGIGRAMLDGVAAFQ